MVLKSVFGTKTLHLSGTVYKPASGERFPLVVINHGTPREAEERKRILQFREQSRALSSGALSWLSRCGEDMERPRESMPRLQENVTVPTMTSWPGR